MKNRQRAPIKKRLPGIRAVALLLAVPLFLLPVSCGAQKAPADPSVVREVLLKNVSYDDALTENQRPAAYFSALPSETEIRMYMGAGTYADEIVTLTAGTEKDVPQLEKAARQHLQDLYDSFVNYFPAELPKISNAVVLKNGCSVYVCVTNDYENAKRQIKAVFSGTEGSACDSRPAESSASAEPSAAVSVPPASVPAVSESSSADAGREPQYPVLKSQSGTAVPYASGVVLRVDNAAYEAYNFDEKKAKVYAGLVNRTAEKLGKEINTYAILIPTAYGITLPDDIRKKLGAENQHTAITKIAGLMNENVRTVDCYDAMMQHRDEYLYFRTDHHWTALGAYYAYTAFCEKKGVPAEPLSQHRTKEFSGFLGAYYQTSCKKDKALSATPDTVIAYLPLCDAASMTFTNTAGKTCEWPIISDVSSWPASEKYNTFAASDSPYAVLTNPAAPEGTSCLVLKESFGNALVPFLSEQYRTVYEIDYRYWSGNIYTFIAGHKVQDVIFANNLTMMHTDYLLAKLAEKVS